MDRQSFLQKLNSALKQSGIKEAERNDILADYEGFFTQGQTASKSESEIALELGEPNDIAMQLANEDGKTLRATFMLKYSKYIPIFFSIFIFFGVALVFHNMREFQFGRRTIVVGGIICNFVMNMALILGLKSKIGKPNFRRISFFLPNIALLVIAVSSGIFLNSQASVDLAFYVFDNLQYSWLGNGLAELRLALLIIAVCIGVWSIYGVVKGKSEHIVTAVHAVGYCVYLEAVYKLWRALSDVDMYWAQIATTSTVYVVTITIVAFSFVVLRKAQRGCA